MAWIDHIPEDIRDLYEVHDYKHAAAILASEFPAEFDELMGALRQFRITIADVKAKYGASTTWMGKLLPRLDAGRGGGCPLLVFGITPRLITDWTEPQH